MTRISPLVFTAIVAAAVMTIVSSGRTADEPSPLTIEGYTDQLSYRPGEVVRFHISTTAGRYSMEIDRLGAETKTVYRKSDLPGASHPIPEDASSNGCRWPVAHSVTVPADWRSGYYNVRLRVADNGGKFVGRNRRTAEIDLFLWYDRFPRDSTGAPTQGAAVFGVYVKGGTVVTTGWTNWAHGLKGGDAVVERITRNVLDRLAK
ncbi:MAG: N,N-dimethylformamidase beta subunit family domain-containing protein [Isosphaerales bacterium]